MKHLVCFYIIERKNGSDTMDIFRYLYNVITSDTFIDWVNRIVLLSNNVTKEKYKIDMNNVYGIQYITISLKNLTEINSKSIVLEFYVTSDYFKLQYDLYNKLCPNFLSYFKNTKLSVYLNEIDSSLDSLIIDYISLTKKQYNFINVPIRNMTLYFINKNTYFNFVYRVETDRQANIKMDLDLMDMRMHLIGEVYLSESGYIDPSCNIRLYDENYIGE